ncbi:probable lysosomal cobalamin transporter isoform X2 [Eurytemora carolleeae]|uniref:probable lysosomal cobalamin transporter isoform X2 n=1 Tax=Eurytemora carolleeae TaxID=1294199 RepID=UPI000C772338|nr:probable lysosomal cobalamin transporter isoform X2 [Eurytemora carolleeae]|eukprot:XP_023346067.1 probable lysosomal cobalamin transporter isoform X2 [Eurytemora affinis]
MFESLPYGGLAYGWIPFTIVLIFCLLFSIIYVLYHRASRPKYTGSAVITILGLFFALVSSLLVPLDVFLVSYMKNTDGSWKAWAETEEDRDTIKNSILYCYYFCYSVVLVFCFLLFPATFFFHSVPADQDEEEPSCGAKLCKSIKFTFVSLLLFSFLVVGGIFIPFNGMPPSNETSWEKIEWFFYELDANKGEDLLVFILNVVNLIGMIILIIYTGFGLSSFPWGILAGRRNVDAERSSLQISIQELESQINEIRVRNGNNSIPRFEQSQLDRLEQQVRLLQREEKDLEQRARNIINRCKLLCMPCRILIGILFTGFGFIIFLSLLLENIDKAIHSEGPYSGYTLVNGTIPNPLDVVLVLTQNIFPLDYILYTALILFLVLSSMKGIKSVGIRFFCVSLYKISLMYIIMALNVIMFSLVPNYTMFGNQHYRHNTTDNTTVVERCGATSFPEKKG